ncbi:MAG: hypothetical protein AAGC45_11665 [Bacteroidota bacterium]
MERIEGIKRTITIISLIVLLFCGCSEDCSDIACFTPPRSFQFEIIDKVSRDNVFTNATYSREDIEVTDSRSGSAVEYTFVSDNEINLIEIFSIGWETEVVNFHIALAEKTVFQLFVDAERRSEDCCSFTEYNAIELSGVEYELDNETGVYRILID